jgi:pyruvate dehydrogenase E2 component (dihydrolipoamide acetyltransferase)
MELKLPLLGDVMTEGTIATWLQSAGSFVAAGSPLYQLETDKVTLIVDAPESGLLEQLVREGETVPVGTIVGRLTAPNGSPANGSPGGEAPPIAGAATRSRESESADAPEVRASPAARRRAEELGVDLSKLGASRRIREADVEAYAAAHRQDPAHKMEVRATPAARVLARRLGVDLSALADGRRIREADVRAYGAAQREHGGAIAPSAPSSPPPHGLASTTGVALMGRRRVIAERMRSSLQTTAQLTISMEVDMSSASELRAQLKQLLPASAQPTVTDLVIRATTLALRDHPSLNATFEHGLVTVHDSIHIGLAADADEGLIVPVISDAPILSLPRLAEQTKALGQRARDNQLQLDELQGGTFTITSLGPLGVDFFTPIINPPQVAILGIGRVFAKLVLDDGKLVERQAMYLNLSFDHQVVDGAPAGRFLQSVKQRLELPASLLL